MIRRATADDVEEIVAIFEPSFALFDFVPQLHTHEEHLAYFARRLDEGEIEAYLDQAGQAVTTSVGAYQLEGLGVHLFERIDGDHFTILGLPLLPLLVFLRGEGLLNV